ncbi:MAG: hypothetical protein NTZ19_06210 [Bacteroidetes bacterium]|nr:hypothetical protein [Bacteroidota bacterium]
MNRPLLITIIAICSIVYGLFEILISIGFGFSSFLPVVQQNENLTVAGVQLMSVIIFVIGLFTLIYGLGMWKLKAWSWWLAVIVNVFNLLHQLYFILGSSGVSNTERYFTVLFTLILLGYLNSKHVKSAFGIGNA